MAEKKAVKKVKKTAKPAKTSAKAVAKAPAKAVAKAPAKATGKAHAKAAPSVEVKVARVTKGSVLSKPKKEIITTHAIHEKDTGSAQVQVAILSHRIDGLQSHLKDHPKDLHSKKGLLAMVGKRRKHLDYLKAKKNELYAKLIEQLGLRK